MRHLCALNEDFGLAGQGYKAAGHEMHGDTLVSRWEPPFLLQKALGPLSLATRRGHLAWVELTTPKGRCMLRHQCVTSKVVGSYTYPTRMETQVLIGRVPGTERVDYDNPVANVPLPAWVLGFHLPADAEVRELR